MTTGIKSKFLKGMLASFTALICILVVFLGAVTVLSLKNTREQIPVLPETSIMNRFDALIGDALADAEAGARSVRKKFWLDEDVTEGPVPNPDCYGTSDDPSTLGWLLEDASFLLEGQDTLFSTDIELKPGSEVIYYLDESIFAVTWQQVINDYVYTISEVKVSHPSQFRRQIADSTYNSKNYYTVAAMSQQVNAVVGSSADHYRGRKFGTKVYEGIVRSVVLPEGCDVCYIDRNGDLILSHRGELMDMESVQKFVDENDIDFSISFGPILIEDGVRCDPPSYALGEVNDKYPRAALCQMDTLHYLVVVGNSEKKYFGTPTIHDFAEVIDTFGCQKAYAMDGGNTGAIFMNGKIINVPSLGYERVVSDIIYFCSAVPDSSQ